MHKSDNLDLKSGLFTWALPTVAQRCLAGLLLPTEVEIIAVATPKDYEEVAKTWPQWQTFFRTWISARHLGQDFFHERSDEVCFS